MLPIATAMRCFGAVALLCPMTWGQTPPAQYVNSEPHTSPSPASGQIRIPSREASALFKGGQGKQRTEIHFDPASNTVTVKLLVQDPNGYFVPNLRRDNFVVYENGVRQKNAMVEVEHTPVSLALLLENGGHYPGLNKLALSRN